MSEITTVVYFAPHLYFDDDEVEISKNVVLYSDHKPVARRVEALEKVREAAKELVDYAEDGECLALRAALAALDAQGEKVK